MSGVKQKAKTSVEMRICNKCGLIDILDTNNWRKYPKEWRIAVSSHSKRCDGEFEWRIDPRLADAQEEIKELKNKNREYAKLVARQAEKYALEIAKLKRQNEQLDSFVKAGWKTNEDRIKLEKRLRQIREHTKNFPELILGEPAIFREKTAYEKGYGKGFYEARNEVVKWKEKLVGLLGK